MAAKTIYHSDIFSIALISEPLRYCSFQSILAQIIQKIFYTICPNLIKFSLLTAYENAFKTKFKMNVLNGSIAQNELCQQKTIIKKVNQIQYLTMNNFLRIFKVLSANFTCFKPVFNALLKRENRFRKCVSLFLINLILGNYLNQLK